MGLWNRLKTWAGSRRRLKSPPKPTGVRQLEDWFVGDDDSRPDPVVGAVGVVRSTRDALSKALRIPKGRQAAVAAGEPLKKGPKSSYMGRYATGGRGDRPDLLITYQEMRLIYRRSEPVRAIVDTICEQIGGAEWAITPSDTDNSLLKEEARQRTLKWAERNGVTDIKIARKRYKRIKKALEQDQQNRIRRLTKLFEHPNEQDDFATFIRKLVQDIEVLDAVAIEKERNWNGELFALHPVDGSSVTMQADEHGTIHGYWQGEGTGKEVFFEPQDMLYLCLNPSTETIYGRSPLETLYLTIATDLFTHKWMSDYFEKNGVPPGVLSLIGATDSTMVDRIIAKIQNVLKNNPFNVPVVGTEMKFTPIAAHTNRDQQLIEYLDKLLERICMVYKVSPAELGVWKGQAGGVGSNVADRQAEIHESKAIKPLLSMLARRFTKGIIHDEFGWLDLKFEFTRDNSEAEEKKREQQIKDLESGLTTPNRILAERGEKPVPWGDQPIKALPYYQPPGQDNGMDGPGMPGQPPGAPGQPPGGPPRPDGFPQQLPANQPDMLEQQIKQHQQVNPHKQSIVDKSAGGGMPLLKSADADEGYIEVTIEVD